MTREESLSIITEAIEDYVCNYVTDTAKAQKMLNAIQTLEQEPCEDAISRQAVLDMWRQMICYDRTCHYRDEGRCTETFCDFKLFEYQINHMPSVKPQICEDTINRQAVLKTLDDMDNVLDEDRTIENYKELLKECYEVLPSVKPQEKTGHWIENASEHQNIDPLYICSECGNPHLRKTDYCDQCGTKMVKEQESEE